jgi:hypothetical protein
MITADSAVPASVAMPVPGERRVVDAGKMRPFHPKIKQFARTAEWSKSLAMSRSWPRIGRSAGI